MRNPNECSTSIRQYTDEMYIDFTYTSASVAKHDLESIKDTYSHAKSVIISGRIITVVIPLLTDEASRPYKTESFQYLTK